MRVLQAPSNIANIAWAMARGLRGRGHHVEVWNHGPSPNGFPLDRVFDVGREPGPYLDCLNEALEAGFEIFHFHGPRTLVAGRRQLPAMWDLPLLSSLGKRLVFTFHGSDIRLASHHAADDRWSFYNHADIPCDEARIKARLELVSAYADHMTVGSVLDLPYAPDAIYVPKPVDPDAYRHVGLRRRRRPVVLHATRRRATKGTAFIEQGVEVARRSGRFEFRLVENASHGQLLEAMADADIVVEKVLGGDAGVLSLEAMAMGKVAVARIRDEVRERHPNLPVVSADPETFGDVLAELVSDRRRREWVAERGRAYVEAEHAPPVVAARLEELYATPRRRRPQLPDAWRAF
ncbi:glycosyltransferase [Egicoccus sp. AB-alg2]|uniref:glycosyltransferase n=1 Tax=Egicoccus sp. AB-alg2 TaxID=3242693 RepID=UPI00359EC311